MKKFHKGFTLVEMAIVIAIVGLLVGGILKGQEMLANARVTSMIAQVQSYMAGLSAFRDKYNAFPGDMLNAAQRIPGCTAACAPQDLANAGNSTIGLRNWGAGGWNAQSGANPAILAGQEEAETVLFWAHLLLSDLITNVGTGALNGAPAAWGITHPGAKIGGGFVAGHGDGTPVPGTAAFVTAGEGPNGPIAVLVRGPATAPGTVAGQQILTPARAGSIDRKADDGLPGSGFVQAYGSGNCFVGGNTNSYNEGFPGADCGLAFEID